MPRPTRLALPALAALLAVALLPGCDREPAPFGRHAAFVPVVLDSRIPGRVPWQTRIDVTNDGPAAGVVRVTRWPPERPEAEVEDYVVPAGATRGIPSRVPLFPSVSSFWLESETPFRVRAAVGNRKGPLPAPARGARSSRPSTSRGPATRFASGRSSPTTRRGATSATPFPARTGLRFPYLTRSVFTGLDGTLFGRFEFGLAGVPTLIEDPWARFSLPEGHPFLLEVTFLGSARGRTPRHGLWVYGIVTDRRTNESRFLPTTVVRAR